MARAVKGLWARPQSPLLLLLPNISMCQRYGFDYQHVAGVHTECHCMSRFGWRLLYYSWQQPAYRTR